MRNVWCASLVAVLAAAASQARASEPQGEKDVELKIFVKNNKVSWDGNGMSPAEYKKMLDKLADDIANKKRVGKIPPPPTLEVAMVFTNKSKEEVTIYVGGDVNKYTFELKGPEVVTLPNFGPMTLDIKMPKAVTLKAGGTYEVLVTKLSDGMRGVSRNVYWAAPGEYTLSVTYQLGDQKGQPTNLLKSESVKFNVEAPK
jgi:hypothetical protein